VNFKFNLPLAVNDALPVHCQWHCTQAVHCQWHWHSLPVLAVLHTHTKAMEKVTRSFKNLYHGIAIPNQIHSTVIALSDESERSQRSTLR